MTDALLPCPFCGAKADTDQPGPVVTEEGYEDTTFSVHCMACDLLVLGFIGDDFYTEAEAIAAWNRRAESAEIERLRAEVERLTAEQYQIASQANRLNDQKNAAEAERDRLREALEGVVSWIDGDYPANSPEGRFLERARAALSAGDTA